MVIYLVLFLQLILYYILFLFSCINIFIFYKDFKSYKKPTILLHQKVNGQQKISNMEMFFLKGNNIF
jgi:hypothetical protein